ncbi:DUF2177 family protein [Patescibacteria group bacterium]|jgi:uncharacterized membrane protein|nr:DUF2177 family protein [Patescibacteria group bacterium]
MSTLQYILVYLASVPVFFLIDMLWLGVIARPFYQSQLADFLGPVNWPAAIVFYLIFLVGVCLFAVYPALKQGDLTYALLWGALFGFFTYATYDLTNLATLKDWPLTVVLVDIAWGAVLSSSVAVGTYLIATWFIV